MEASLYYLQVIAICMVIQTMVGLLAGFAFISGFLRDAASIRRQAKDTLAATRNYNAAVEKLADWVKKAEEKRTTTWAPPVEGADLN